MEIVKSPDYPNNYAVITISSSTHLWIIWDALERMLIDHTSHGGQHVLELTTMIACIEAGLQELYYNAES